MKILPVGARRRVKRRKQLVDDREEKTEYCKLRNHEIALCGEVALKEGMDLL